MSLLEGRKALQLYPRKEKGGEKVHAKIGEKCFLLYMQGERKKGDDSYFPNDSEDAAPEGEKGRSQIPEEKRRREGEAYLFVRGREK